MADYKGYGADLEGPYMPNYSKQPSGNLSIRPSLPVGATDTHESTYSTYKQGRDAKNISRAVRPELTEE
jgi:hypothetical protein